MFCAATEKLPARRATTQQINNNKMLNRIKTKWKSFFWELKYVNGEYVLTDRHIPMIILGFCLLPFEWLKWICNGLTSSTDIYIYIQDE